MVRKCLPGDPAQRAEAGGVRGMAAATLGNWGEVWDNFDRRAKAKASNDVVPVGDDAGEDMFARAGVAAE